MTLYTAAQNQAAQDLTGMIVDDPALAGSLLKILEQSDCDVAKLELLVLSALKSVQDALPKSQLSTEQTLREENRIQDDAAILEDLGFKGELPSIPAALLEECVRTSGTLVLKFKTTVLDYKAKLNAALGWDNELLHLYIEDRSKSLATTNEEPSWINVPNTVRVDTLGLSNVKALNHVPGSATCDPMDTVLMLGYNNLKTWKQLAGFTNKFTFTNQKDTLVGSDGGGIYVGVDVDYVGVGTCIVGLAPRLAPESKN